MGVRQCDLDLGSSHYIYSRHQSATHTYTFSKIEAP